jgi:hypothetical protein
MKNECLVRTYKFPLVSDWVPSPSSEETSMRSGSWTESFALEAIIVAGDARYRTWRGEINASYICIVTIVSSLLDLSPYCLKVP